MKNPNRLQQQEALEKLKPVLAFATPFAQKKAAVMTAEYLNRRKERRLTEELGHEVKLTDPAEKPATKTGVPVIPIAASGIIGVVLGVVAGVLLSKKGLL